MVGVPEIAGRELPHNPDAEAGLLGCCLIEGAPIVTRCRDAGVTPSSFYSPAHRTLFESLLALADRGSGINPITVCTELKNRGQLERIGGESEPAGAAFVAGITNRVGTTAHVGDFIKIVTETHRRRQCIRAATAFVEKCFAGEPDHDALLALISDRRSTGWPPLETIPDQDEGDDAPGPAIVDGLFERGDKVVFGGGSKTFKTWSFIDLGLSVSHGVSWWGRRTTKGPVLFLNFELKPKNFRRRVRKVQLARGLGPTSSFVVWNLRGCGFSMDQHLAVLLERIRGREFSLIVLDPIYKLYGERNENSAGDMADLMRLLDRLATEAGAAVVFGAHFAKGNQSGKDSMDRISGSGVFARDPDCIVTLTRLDEAEGDDTFTVEATVRDFPPVAPFGVHFDYPIMKPVAGVNLANVRQTGARAKFSVDDMLGLLKEKPLTASEWQAACEERLSMPRSSFYNYAPRAKKQAQCFQGKWSLPIAKRCA